MDLVANRGSLLIEVQELQQQFDAPRGLSFSNVGALAPQLLDQLEGVPDRIKDLLERIAKIKLGPRALPSRHLDETGLLAFFADRLKVLLRDEGKRHDLVDAVFALGDDDLVRIVRRVEALDGFLKTEDGASLLAGYKRAANILKAEAKKTPEAEIGLNEDLDALVLPEEQALSAALRTVQGQVDTALENEDFEGAMRFLSHLRTPVDAFFDKVLVNDPDPAVRLNRLRLLSAVRSTANRIADFSLVNG
jgi:glycyl-tRNA synthetase beta chain